MSSTGSGSSSASGWNRSATSSRWSATCGSRCPRQGFRLRAFVKGQDERRWLAAHNEAFSDHWGYRPWPEKEFLYWVGTTKWFRPELSLIAEAEDGEIAGICHNVIDEEEIARIGRKEGWVELFAVRRPHRYVRNRRELSNARHYKCAAAILL